MKKTLFFILFLILFRAFCLPLNRNFKIVKIIGNDQADLIFSGITDALLTPCKDIIILDGKGNYIARYDWDGNFINRVGQKGQGAGDFRRPTSASIFNDKLYILDRFNNRFVESGLDLKNLRYFKLPPNIRMPRSLNVIGKNKFIIDNISIMKPDAAKIGVIEITGKINTETKKLFFNDTPIDIQSINEGSRTSWRLGQLFKIVYGIDHGKKRMLITFQNTDNPVSFFLYGTEGGLIKKFSHQMDKKYGFPHYLHKTKKLSLNSLKGRYNLNAGGIFYYDNHWYVFFSQYHYRNGGHEMKISNLKEYTEIQSFYLQFDEHGTFLGKFVNDPDFVCFDITKDGYVLGKHPDSEVEQLVIYKILKNKEK
jgi:hypothetical protein